jgi:hypothetical protein
LKPAYQIHATVGVEISAILLKAMAQKPEGRYASANEFREALRRLGRVEPKINQVGKVNEVGPIKTKHDGPRLRLDMVVSKKRFGPGAATVILMSTLGLGAGALYGSQRWLQALDVSSAVPALSLKQSATSRRIEKPRGPQAMEVSSPKVKHGVDNDSARAAEKSDAEERSSNRVPREKQPTKRVYRYRIEAPSIRMPNPEPRDGVTPPADGISNEH